METHKRPFPPTKNRTESFRTNLGIEEAAVTGTQRLNMNLKESKFRIIQFKLFYDLMNFTTFDLKSNKKTISLKQVKNSKT